MYLRQVSENSNVGYKKRSSQSSQSNLFYSEWNGNSCFLALAKEDTESSQKAYPKGLVSIKKFNSCRSSEGSTSKYTGYPIILSSLC